MEREIRHLVNCLKMIGILLIINSHSDALFPKSMSALATGGALGNGIFFIISGFFVSEKRNSFQSSILRFLRLYIPVYIMLLAYAFTQNNYIAYVKDLKTWFEVFIWPTPYWFVSASFVSYVLLDICKQWIDKEHYKLFSIGMLFIYLIVYFYGVENKNIWIVEDGKIFNLNIHFKVIYCFYLYSLGLYVKRSGNRMNGRISALLAFGSFIMMYVLKLLMQRAIVPMEWQVVTQLCVICFSLGVLSFSLTYEDVYLRLHESVVHLIDRLSRVSLEAYVIQIFLIPIIARILQDAFPISYIVSVVLVLALSCGLYYLDNAIIKRIKALIPIV